MAKVLLLDSPSWRLFNPRMHLHLGILYLAGSLRAAGHDVRVLDCHKITSWDGQNLILHRELMEECDVLGISATTANVNWGLEMVRPWPARVKVLGGPHVNHIVEGPHEKFKQTKFFEGVDYLMFGECEESFVQFCNWVDEFFWERDAGGLGYSLAAVERYMGIPGIIDLHSSWAFRQYSTRPRQPDVKSLPGPAFDLWREGFSAGALSSPSVRGRQFNANELMTASLYTARGCPYGCKFCADARTTLREESVSQIERQLAQLRDLGVRAVRIQDDTFTIRAQRCREISDVLSRFDFRWRATTRVNLRDPSLFRYMSSHGCTELGFGIEHGSARMLKAMEKGTTPEANELGVKMCQDAGMFARAFLMIGFPGETEDTIQELEEWVLQVKPDAVTLSLFQPFPGSDVWNHPEKYGVAISDNAFDHFWQLGGDDDPGMLILKLPTISRERLFYYRRKLVETFEREIGHLDRMQMHGNVGTFASEAAHVQ